MAWTATDLLASIRLRAMLPDAQSDYTDVALLKLADEVMAEVLMPELQRVNGEYGIQRDDQAIRAGISEYLIPWRAVGGKLRSVTLVDSSGNAFDVPPMSIEQRDQLSQSFMWGASGYSYTIEGNSVVLLPTPVASNGTLRLRYMARPGALVSTLADARSIIDYHAAAPGEIIEVGDDPGYVVIYPVTTPDFPQFAQQYSFIDITYQRPIFNTVAHDCEIVATALDSFTVYAPDLYADYTRRVADGVPIPDVYRGSYITAAGNSYFPQIPAELHPTLAQAVVVKVLEQMGDRAGMQAAQEKMQESLAQQLRLLAPRNDGGLVRIKNNYSMLRRRFRGRGWW